MSSFFRILLAISGFFLFFIGLFMLATPAWSTGLVLSAFGVIFLIYFNTSVSRSLSLYKMQKASDTRSQNLSPYAFQDGNSKNYLSNYSGFTGSSSLPSSASQSGYSGTYYSSASPAVAFKRKSSPLSIILSVIICATVILGFWYLSFIVFFVALLFARRPSRAFASKWINNQPGMVSESGDGLE